MIKTPFVNIIDYNKFLQYEKAIEFIIFLKYIYVYLYKL